MIRTNSLILNTLGKAVLPIVGSDLLPPHFGPKSDHFFLKNQTKIRPKMT